MESKINELVELVRYHQDKYYNGEPEISDAEFDALWDELTQLAPEHEIVQTVGYDASAAFSKRPHIMPMNSQAKAADPESFRRWYEKVGHGRVVVQHKLDGASIELQYRAGRLAYCVTRGDGLVGDDVTVNVSQMQGVPSRLDLQFEGALRGEVMMRRSVHAEHYPDKANCRNAANGIMKRKDGQGAQLLEVVVYDALAAEDDEFFRDEEAKLAWLQEQGLDVVEYRFCDSADEVIEYREEVMQRRPEMEFDIDGLVVKELEIDLDDVRRARPERQIAFKFELEEAVSTLREVHWSESGHLYTPIGIIDPVRLAGTTVKRANLVNPRMIEQLDLRIGSRVAVTKRGEIIPKIERLVENPPDAPAVLLPESCGVCGAELYNAGTRLFCPNFDCPKRRLHRIRKWIEVLGVKDFGPVMVRKLFDDDLLRDIPDLYRLKEEDIAGYEGMGLASARKALENLGAVGELPLARFIAGFDIEGIGELIVARLVSAGYDTLETLQSASPEELSAVDGIGEITAATVLDGLRKLAPQMKDLLEMGGVSIAAPPKDGALRGKSLCITGTLTHMKRSEAEKRIVEAGGLVRSTVTKDLTYLVTNEPESGSAKNRRAQELGVPILSEAELVQLLEPQ